MRITKTYERFVRLEFRVEVRYMPTNLDAKPIELLYVTIDSKSDMLKAVDQLRELVEKNVED